jgi:hypothetical protein
MKEYLVEEFIGGAEPYTIAEQVDKKISLLYDMCILTKRGTRCDKREELVKQWLLTYQTDTQIDNAVFDIIIGKCTLNELLKRKGYLQ